MAFQTSGLGIRLEAKETSSYSGSGSTWNDISGVLNINATNYGTVFQSTAPKHFLFNNNDDSMGFAGNSIFKFASGVSKGIGVWINLNETTATHTHPIMSRKASGNGFGFEFTVVNRNLVFKYKNDAIDVSVQSTNTPITLTGWHYIFVKYTPGGASTSIQLSVDGVQVAQTAANNTVPDTFGGDFYIGYDPSRSPANFYPGKIGAVHFYSSNASNTTALDNYNDQQAYYNAININITETPATSTALFVDPVISTTIGVDVVETPATADVLFVDPIFSTEVVDISHTSIIATAMMTEPTLSFSFDDNVQVVTSILVDALFVEPASVGVSVSSLADPMTASADAGTETLSIGTGIIYVPEPVTADALFVEPADFGPPDVTNIVDAITATALMGSTGTSIPNNYRNLVKKHTPIIYGTQQATPNWRFMVNDGYGQFNAIDNGDSAAAKDAASIYEFAGIGNQHSWSTDITLSKSQNNFTFTGNPGMTDIKNAWKAKTWTLEMWFIPGDIVGNAIVPNPGSLVPSGPKVLISSALEFSATGEAGELGSIMVRLKQGGSQQTIYHGNYVGYGPYNPMEEFLPGWNYVAITAEPLANNQIKISSYVNGLINDASTLTFPTTDAYDFYNNQVDNESGYITFTPPYNVGSYFEEPAFYGKTLTPNEIYEHWNFVKTYSPNSFNSSTPFLSLGEFVNPTLFIVANRVHPETPVTADATFVDPLVGFSTTITATTLTADADSVNPYFYGDPDFNNLTAPMTATAETLQNIFRLDTAYYSYVQTNIAPIRFVTFDNPDSTTDFGSDNDYASAVPFVSNGTISSPLVGLNNNSLVTTGANYLTDGLIMKESEYNDSWGSVDGIYHFSFWIKKSGTDTNPLGLRIIANVNSYLNNEYILLYQYGDYIYLQVNDQTNSVINVASSQPVNVFDNNKKHIVLVASHPGSNGNIKVYVNKVLVINSNISNVHPQFINATSYLNPNSETNNHPRFSVNCLITPLNQVTLPLTPTPSIVSIDDVHWAVTSLNQTQVTNLNDAMPYSLDNFFDTDFALAQNATLVDPTFGVGSGIDPALFSADALFVSPTLIVDFDKVVPLEKIDEASALFVNPTFFADNITNISIVAAVMPAGAAAVLPLVFLTYSFPTMYASANMQFQSPYLDPYNLLIYQQSLMSPIGNFYNRIVGDVDTL